MDLSELRLMDLVFFLFTSDISLSIYHLCLKNSWIFSINGGFKMWSVDILTIV